MGGATVHCANGLVRKLGVDDGRTEISFDVHARDFPVDDGLANSGSFSAVADCLAGGIFSSCFAGGLADFIFSGFLFRVGCRRTV